MALKQQTCSQSNLSKPINFPNNEEPFKKPTRILITGASGFIGSKATRALLAGGHDVALLVMPGDPLWRLRDVTDQCTVLTGTLADAPVLQPALAEWSPEACLHFAWYAEPGAYLHSIENISSLTASLALMQTLAQVGCRQFVGAGTCAEYDTDQGFLREEGSTRPATLYAAAKLSFCMLGQHLAAAAGMRFAWGRIFYPYGPGENPRRVVPAVIHTLRSGQTFPATPGEQVRDYVHVEDVAAGFCALVEKGAQGVFNIASGEPTTIRHLLELIGEIVGRPELLLFGALPYREWEPMFICGNVQKLKSLGWIPRFSLREGLSQTVVWWQAQTTHD